MELDHTMKVAVNCIVLIYIYNLYFYINLGSLIVYIGLPVVIYKSNNKAVSKFKETDSIFEFIKKHHVKITVVLTISLLLYLKNQWLIEVTHPVTTVFGAKQRIKIYDKYENYIEYMNNNGDRRIKHIAFNPLIYWPVSPSSYEMQKLEEYLIIVFYEYQVLTEKKRICNLKHYYLSTGKNDIVLTEAKKIVRSVNKHIKMIKDNENVDVTSFIDEALLTEYPC